jgi:hypothetical protein
MTDSLRDVATRTLADYRPQHDDDCDVWVYSDAEDDWIEQGPCSCGLAALLSSVSVTQQDVASSPLVHRDDEQQKNLGAGATAVDTDPCSVLTPQQPHD